MAVAIRLASLWTHAMFAVLTDLDNSGLGIVDRKTPGLTFWASSSSSGRIQAVAYFIDYLVRGAEATSATLRSSVGEWVVGCRMCHPSHGSVW